MKRICGVLKLKRVYWLERSKMDDLLKAKNKSSTGVLVIAKMPTKKVLEQKRKYSGIL